MYVCAHPGVMVCIKLGQYGEAVEWCDHGLRVGEGRCGLWVGEGRCGLRVGEGRCGLRVGEGRCGLRVGEGRCGLRGVVLISFVLEG